MPVFLNLCETVIFMFDMVGISGYQQQFVVKLYQVSGDKNWRCIVNMSGSVLSMPCTILVDSSDFFCKKYKAGRWALCSIQKSGVK